MCLWAQKAGPAASRAVQESQKLGRRLRKCFCSGAQLWKDDAQGNGDKIFTPDTYVRPLSVHSWP
jgi:hypothetical protein